MVTDDSEPNGEMFAAAERAIRRYRLVQQIRKLGGEFSPSIPSDVSDLELSFLAQVVAWETGPFSSHGQWLARHGFVFDPPCLLRGRRLKRELRRLIEALAVARVFVYHTNHLSDAELYGRLWDDVLNGEEPEFTRSHEGACHWDFADPGSGDEQLWLTYYASETERRNWAREFRDVVLPPRRRTPYRRDHWLPTPY